MIVITQTTPVHQRTPDAEEFDVIDLETGFPPIDPATGHPLRVWYVDDLKGLIRYYVEEPDGAVKMNSLIGSSVCDPVSDERRGRFRVISAEEGQRLRVMMSDV